MRTPVTRAIDACRQGIETPGVEQVRLSDLQALLAALDPDARTAFGWLCLADLAVWPQLPVANVGLSAQALRQGQAPALVGQPMQGLALAVQGSVELATGGMPHRLHQGLEELLKTVRPSMQAWEQWLLRVTSAVLVVQADDARELAARALEATITAPLRWGYEAAAGEKGETSVHIATPAPGGQLGAPLAIFTGCKPNSARRIEAAMQPTVAVDRYRMGYWLQSTILAELTRDYYQGRYDTLVCTNQQTGETWSTPAL